jgi:hypothetical protein
MDEDAQTIYWGEKGLALTNDPYPPHQGPPHLAGQCLLIFLVPCNSLRFSGTSRSPLGRVNPDFWYW